MEEAPSEQDIRRTIVVLVKQLSAEDLGQRRHATAMKSIGRALMSYHIADRSKGRQKTS